MLIFTFIIIIITLNFIIYNNSNTSNSNLNSIISDFINYFIRFRNNFSNRWSFAFSSTFNNKSNITNIILNFISLNIRKMKSYNIKRRLPYSFFYTIILFYAFFMCFRIYSNRLNIKKILS